MKNCPECDTEIIGEVTQCPSCGFPLEPSSAPIPTTQTPKILFANTSVEANVKHAPEKVAEKTIERPNLFQSSIDPVIAKAKFPDWDIIPPSQFINPRIKKL